MRILLDIERAFQGTNTWGLRSVNHGSFNNKIIHDVEFVYSKEERDLFIKILKIHNFVLDILGYIPGVSIISGCIRILTGFTFYVFNIMGSNPHANDGQLFSGPNFDEAINTAKAQMIRGAIEAMPYAKILNLFLDIIATNENTQKDLNFYQELHRLRDYAQITPPYDDPVFSRNLQFLAYF